MEDSGSWIWDDYNNDTILNTNNNICENVNCDELLNEDLIYLGKVIKSDKHIINFDENVFK